MSDEAAPTEAAAAKAPAAKRGFFSRLFGWREAEPEPKFTLRADGDASAEGAKAEGAKAVPLPVEGDESIMAQKAHGTSDVAVQQDLRWDCDWETADRICNFNRHYAEHSGYFRSTTFVKDLFRAERESEKALEFFDSNTSKRLFAAPTGRSFQKFLDESKKHGWPSFRDAEVNWDLVRCLPNGECVSVDGTHLGHNLPDSTGNRYCINLVSVAGHQRP